MSYTYNTSGGFEWGYYSADSNNENADTLEKYIEQKPFTLEHLKIKVQVFASRFGKNNCYEDMNFIARNGCICVQYREKEDFYNNKTNIQQHLTISILEKEEKFNQSKMDFCSYGANSHLFFEIPVIQNFTEHQFNKWLNYLAREMPKKAKLNVKRRQIWLRKKQLENDFDELQSTN